VSGAARSDGLLRALARLMPEAELSVEHDRPWHSLTFAGTQLCLSAIVAGDKHTEIAEAFASALPDHEFCLNGQIAADIAVTSRQTSTGETRLIIDVLLLDD
jgi:hypothetical protein